MTQLRLHLCIIWSAKFTQHGVIAPAFVRSPMAARPGMAAQVDVSGSGLWFWRYHSCCHPVGESTIPYREDRKPVQRQGHIRHVRKSLGSASIVLCDITEVAQHVRYFLSDKRMEPAFGANKAWPHRNGRIFDNMKGSL